MKISDFYFHNRLKLCFRSFLGCPIFRTQNAKISDCSFLQLWKTQKALYSYDKMRFCESLKITNFRLALGRVRQNGRCPKNRTTFMREL